MYKRYIPCPPEYPHEKIQAQCSSRPYLTGRRSLHFHLSDGLRGVYALVRRSAGSALLSQARHPRHLRRKAGGTAAAGQLPAEFGLLPKAVVWGILGVFIWIAFGIFSKGVTGTFFSMPISYDPAAHKSPFRIYRIETSTKKLIHTKHALDDAEYRSMDTKRALTREVTTDIQLKSNPEKLYKILSHKTNRSFVNRIIHFFYF